MSVNPAPLDQKNFTMLEPFKSEIADINTTRRMTKREAQADCRCSTVVRGILTALLFAGAGFMMATSGGPTANTILFCSGAGLGATGLGMLSWMLFDVIRNRKEWAANKQQLDGTQTTLEGVELLREAMERGENELPAVQEAMGALPDEHFHPFVEHVVARYATAENQNEKVAQALLADDRLYVLEEGTLKYLEQILTLLPMEPVGQVGEVVDKIPDQALFAFLLALTLQGDNTNQGVIQAVASQQRVHEHVGHLYNLVRLLEPVQAKAVFAKMGEEAFRTYVTGKWEHHGQEILQALAEDPKAHAHEHFLSMLEFLDVERTTVVLRTMESASFQALVEKVRDEYSEELTASQAKVVQALAAFPQPLAEIVLANERYENFIPRVFAQMNEEQKAAFLQVLLDACDANHEAKERVEPIVHQLIQEGVTIELMKQFNPEDLDQSFEQSPGLEPFVTQIIRRPEVLARHMAKMKNLWVLVPICKERMESEAYSRFMQTLGTSLEGQNQAQAYGNFFAQLEDELMYEAMAHAPVAFAYADAKKGSQQYEMYGGVRPFMTAENHAIYLEQLHQLNPDLCKARVTKELQELGSLEQAKLDGTGLVGFFMRHPELFRDWVVDNSKAYIDGLIEMRHKVALALLERMGEVAEQVIPFLDKNKMGLTRFKRMVSILLDEAKDGLPERRQLLIARFQYAEPFNRVGTLKSYPSNLPCWTKFGEIAQAHKEAVYQKQT